MYLTRQANRELSMSIQLVGIITLFHRFIILVVFCRKSTTIERPLDEYTTCRVCITIRVVNIDNWLIIGCISIESLPMVYNLYTSFCDK